MPTEFKLPELGENVEKGDVVRVMVSAGDVIKVDQPVVELETDKATIEVPSSVSGKVSEVRVKPGDRIKVGQTVLILEEDPAAEQPAAAAAQEDASAAPQAEPKVAAAKARPADPPAKSAAVVDITSARPAAAAAAAPAPARVEGAVTVPAAPSVRRFARELGVPIGDVAGSGPGGRIGQDDVKQHVKGAMGASPSSGQSSATLPDFSRWGDVEVKAMSNIRRKTAQHLTTAWQAPHVTQNDKADMSALEAFRATYGPRVEKVGAKLTVTVVLVKMVSVAIDKFPQFASSVDMANESIILKKYRHVGVAVDTPNGLMVPVIRDVNRKSMTDIAIELGVLSKKAQDRKLSLDEMAGGVFTISNLGGIGGYYFTPLINQPEVAILGVSRGIIEPVWRDEKFVPCQMLPLSLSYDHRVIDGADAARFLRFVAEAIEQPLALYL